MTQTKSRGKQMKKHLVLLALVAAVTLAGCSAKDSARLGAAVAVADAVVEIVAPVEDNAAEGNAAEDNAAEQKEAVRQ